MPVTYYPAGSVEIRDATAALIQGASATLGLKNVFKARTKPGQDSQLPYAVVWAARERTEPNGDANVGAPSFFHRLILVVDVMMAAQDDAALDAQIVTITENIRGLLLTNADWVMMSEAVERCDVSYSYPKEATDIMVQSMIEFELTFRSDWEPIVPNDFLKADFKTTAPHAGVEMLVEIPQS